MFTRNMVGKMTMADAQIKVYKLTTNVMVNRRYNANSSYNQLTANGGLTYNETATSVGSYVFSSWGIVLGTGTTAPTIDDYKMESYIPEGTLSYTGSSFTLPLENGEWANNGTFSLTQTVANNTETPVTVTELGVYNSGNTGTARPCILLTRDVISSVTIQPNETKTFVVAWNLADILNGGSTTVTTKE